MILIELDAKLEASPGNFGARILGRELHVPEKIGVALEHLGVGSAEEFVSMTFSFPTALCSELGWTPHNLAMAREGLIAVLRGHIDERQLAVEGAPFERGMGARPPRSR